MIAITSIFGQRLHDVGVFCREGLQFVCSMSSTPTTSAPRFIGTAISD